MLLEDFGSLEPKSVKLGKNIELRYIPFSELVIPWNIFIDSANQTQNVAETKQPGIVTYGTVTANGSKSSKTLKRQDLEALRNSVGQFGLLKPFEVAELPERLGFYYGGKGKYLVIDGQRRYFAIRELLNLPTEQEEKEQKESIRTNSGHEHVAKAEVQAQQQFDKLNIRDYVLIPCLVYPYDSFLQMVRHSIEDKKFSEKPSKPDLQLVEKMRREGVQDITAEDLSELWETRSKLEEEKQAIENTLQEIRKRTKLEANEALPATVEKSA